MSFSNYIDIIRSTAKDGGPGFAQVALTNDCNANCGFCGFARERGIPKASAPMDRLLRAVDILYGKGIRYLVYVGGEPLMYPGLDEVVRYTRKKGIEPVICTNGHLLGEDRLLGLKASGLKNIIISIDAPDDRVHDENRGLAGLATRIRGACGIMAREGMHATASVTISRLLGDISRLPAYLDGMGFRDVTFSYPLTELYSGYRSYSDSGLVRFSPLELIDVFGRLKKLKDSIRVLNPSTGMDEMVRHLKGKPARFPCLAGYKYFFLDWDLDVYRCHYREDPICAVEEFMDAEPIRDDCSDCMIDCYRDPSVLQHGAVSLSDSLRSLAKGRVGESARHLFKRTNYVSLMAVIEQFALVRRYGEL